METFSHINKDKNLSGVVCKPEYSAAPSPAMIFINAGFLHHVGPYRLYTTLARILQQSGTASLRFDLAGLGDSLSHPTNISDASPQTPVADVKSAMDYMQNEHGIDNFIVCGLCSGADDSLEAAMEDERIVGALLVDGPGFHAGRFKYYHYSQHFLRRILSLQKWKLILNRTVRRIGVRFGVRQEETLEHKLDDEIRKDIPEAQVRVMVAELLSRGVALHFLYTGGVSDYFNHESQFEAMFPEHKNNKLLTTSYHPDSDHLFMLESHRNAAIDQMVSWVRSAFQIQ